MTGAEYFPGGDEAAPFFRGLKARIAATLVLLVGGLCWVVLYLAFLAGRFPWYQNLAIVLVSFIVFPAVVVVMWIFWGISVGRRFRRALRDAEFP
jgi:ABC-type amino acid transport system permease subunit